MVNSKEAKYLLVNHYIEQDQYDKALKLLQQIPVQFSLSEWDREGGGFLTLQT